MVDISLVRVNINQWEFQDPKMKVSVSYLIRPYFMVMFPYIGLIYGRYLRFRILKWPLNKPSKITGLHIVAGDAQLRLSTEGQYEFVKTPHPINGPSYVEIPG
jgi:hypothetical protein